MKNNLNLRQNLINVDDYYNRARLLMPSSNFDYFAGASCDEITLHKNQSDFQNIEILPSVLKDVSSISLDCQILNHDYKFPLMLAPLAFQSLAYPSGEIESAKAAGDLGINMILSTLSSTSLENVIRYSRNAWFQLYLFKDRKINLDLIERAKIAGYKAIVVTVDSQFSGKRERDWRNNFSLPNSIAPANLSKYNFPQLKARTDSWLHNFIDQNYDKSFTWSDLQNLIENCSLPVLVKGILTSHDAKQAINMGAAGIVVSNHGGRTIDTAISAIKALARLTEKINPDETTILFDSGIRRGSDIFKALCLGAKAVCIGRPYIWGLAVERQMGVVKVINLLVEELKTTMGIAGVNDIGLLNRDYIIV